MNVPFYGSLNISADDVVQKRRVLADTEFSELLFIDNTKQSINKFIQMHANEFSDLIIPMLEIYTLLVML
jgi:hypothetical protein